MFETRLGLRMDYEACLAYLLLPPAGGVLLLMLEHRSDYVRFHAWQSSLLFSFIFVSLIEYWRERERRKLIGGTGCAYHFLVVEYNIVDSVCGGFRPDWVVDYACV